MRSWIQRLLGRARALWKRALNERSTPREVGWSVGVGVFSGCTPFIGAHMWIALGLATALRLNRLWAFLGSRVPSNVLLVGITFVEIELAHRLRAGAWAPLAWREALDHATAFVGDWFLGAALVGPALGAVLGLAAYATARRRAGVTPPRTPGEPLLPISESPPTAPRTPPR